MYEFDVTIYNAINGMAGHIAIVDQIMKFFAQYALELYAVLFVVAWFMLPKREFETRHALVVSGLAGVLALLINVIIGFIWPRPRPFAVFPKGTFTQLIPHANDASFPSDHTSGSFGFAAGSWGAAPRWIQISFTLIAALVMFARVYCGVHYPSDVLAGLLVGVFSGRIMWRFSRVIAPLSRLICKMFRYGPEALAGK